MKRVVPRTNRKTIIMQDRSPEENLLYNIVLTAFYDIDNSYNVAKQYIDKINNGVLSTKTKSDCSIILRELESNLISAIDFFLELDNSTITKQIFIQKYNQIKAFKFCVCAKCGKVFLYTYRYPEEKTQTIPYRNFDCKYNIVRTYKYIFFLKNTSTNKLVECPNCGNTILSSSYGVASNVFYRKEKKLLKKRKENKEKKIKERKEKKEKKTKERKEPKERK